MHALPNSSDDDESEFDSKFEYIDTLGEGTFGFVYKVRSKLDNHVYAVKKVRIRRTDNVQSKLREVQALALITHPGIVKYNHAWMEDGFLYIQMELCRSPLNDWLSKHEDRRNLILMEFWFMQILAAVEYIHRLGKIHRDLKPGNILVVNEDYIKVSDFGEITDISIANDDSDVEECGDSGRTHCRGTPLYMAPEQKRRSLFDTLRYTNKVDIFSLGLIMAEMFLVMKAEERETAFTIYQNGGNYQSFEERMRELKMIRSLNLKSQFDLFSIMIDIDDTKRPNCQEIRGHPFLALFANWNQEGTPETRSSVPNATESK